jgi:hypothetical protein
VAQDVGPEFKLQYYQKKKKKGNKNIMWVTHFYFIKEVNDTKLSFAY